MGISTFLQLLSDAELDILQSVNALSGADGIFKALLDALVKRGFIGDPDAPMGKGADVDEGDSGEGVDVLGAIVELLSTTAAVGDHVRLEQKSKFWEATISGSDVHVTYGRKGTAGQKNLHSGHDAREYFAKKVHEKVLGGYKVVDADKGKRDELVARLESLRGGLTQTRSKGKSKRDALATPNDKYRADLDKCAPLVAYLVSRALGLPKDTSGMEYEMLSPLLKGVSLGQDVCYGSVYVVDAAQVAALHERVAPIDFNKNISPLFDHCEDFPTVLGGLSDVSRTEEEYARHHFGLLKKMLRHAADMKCGLLLHFW